MTLCICDDDDIFTKNLRDILRILAPRDRILDFTSGFALLEYLEIPQNDIDILFLDIEMPHLNGLETAAELRRTHPHLAVVVITEYPKYALPCYDFSPVHFIVKPVTAEKIRICLDRAKRAACDDVVLIKTKDGLKYVWLYQVYAIESYGLQVKLTLNKQFVYVYQALSHYEKQLTGKGFYRIHKNAIVNLMYVQSVEGENVALENGQSLKVSRRRKSGFMTELLKWRKAYA